MTKEHRLAVKLEMSVVDLKDKLLHITYLLEHQKRSLEVTKEQILEVRGQLVYALQPLERVDTDVTHMRSAIL